MFLKSIVSVLLFSTLFQSDVFGQEQFDLKSVYGMGPALSKVYQVPEGNVSFGAYAELYYINYAEDAPSKTRDIMNAYRFVPIIGYHFNEWIVANAELEFEHGMVSGTTSPGNVSGRGGYAAIEFLYIDFLLSKGFNIRSGLMLVPVGIVNEIHEPPTFHGVLRPEVEREIIPSTWYDTGVGIHGEFNNLKYRAYLLNGPDMALYSEGSGGIKSMRQRGARAISEDFAGVVRLDYQTSLINIGGSVYHGGADQQRLTDGNVDITLAEVHTKLNVYGMEIRALYAATNVSGADKLNTFRKISSTGIGSVQLGWYVEVSYNILPLFLQTDHYLAPFVRYEKYDTHAQVPDGYSRNPAYDRTTTTVGLTYKPDSKVVVKADYSIKDDARDNAIAKPSNLFNLGIGFMF